MKKFKKLVLVLGVFGATFSFANTNIIGNNLELINNDIKAVNTFILSDVTDINNNAELSLLTLKVNNINKEIVMLNTMINSKSVNSTTINKILDGIDSLSTSTFQLAREIAFLSNYQTDNANESYNNTLHTLIKATLRLSDDIGKMADRILLMAKQIGIMADRILITQRIQSTNYNNTIKLLTNLNN